MINIFKIGKENQGTKEYNGNAVMSFFEELLDFFGHIREFYQETCNPYMMVVYAQNSQEINLLEEDCAENLVIFFEEIYSDAKEKEIIIKEKISEMENARKCVYYKKQGIFEVETCPQADIERLTFAQKALENTFVDDTIKGEFNECVMKLKGFQETETKNKFYKKKHIFEYLNNYYEILCLLISDSNILMTEGIAECVVLPLLKLGLKRSDNGEFTLSMTSPVVLSALNLIYSRLNQLVTLSFSKLEQKSENIIKAEKIFYSDIFLSKIHQIFRFFVVMENKGELYHAALPIYDIRKRKASLCLPVRALSTYNSFQGIRELRLSEKILFELQQYIENVKSDEFVITLIGEIEKAPLEEMIAYVNHSINKKIEYRELKDIKLKYIVYTISADSIYERGNQYEIRKYDDLLKSIQRLDPVLEEANLLFFLDNCQMYDVDVEKISDMIIFRQYISSESYEDFYKKSTYNDLKLDCKFMELYNALMCYCWKGELGYWKKNAKENLIKYIKNYVYNSVNKTAYIYISDIDAFKRLTCIQKHFVRIEKYNEKEIGIIRFTTHEREQIAVKAKCAEQSDRNLLVFNMWQVVKHIAINHKEYFEEIYIRDKEDGFLNDIYIGFDYTQWKDRIEVYYHCENEKTYEEENIRKTILVFLDKIKHVSKLDMYQKYIKKSFVSFLYGSAQSVEDLLFLHIFKKYDELVGTYQLSGKDCNLKQHYNLNCKYSYKKNYWEAIEKFDNYSLNYIDRYTILKHAEVIDSREESFSDCILNACKNIGYIDSKLYKNFQDIDETR